ncbi:unnamed protein product, partial [Clonostachys byssicola]
VWLDNLNQVALYQFSTEPDRCTGSDGIGSVLIITAAHSLGIAWKLPNTFTVPIPPMGRLHLMATFGLQD